MIKHLTSAHGALSNLWSSNRAAKFTATLRPSRQKQLCKFLSATATALVVMGSCLSAAAAEPPSEKELKQLWAELGQQDPVRADKAITRLVSQPAAAVAFLRERLGPARAADPQRLAGWFKDLDSNSFKVREKATGELARFGEAIEAELKDAMRRDIPLEARRRIERLLEEVKHARQSPSTERKSTSRAIDVLERIGDRAARDVLDTLALGAAQAQLTVDARMALERLVQNARQQKP